MTLDPKVLGLVRVYCTSLCAQHMCWHAYGCIEGRFVGDNTIHTCMLGLTLNPLSLAGLHVAAQQIKPAE